MVIPAYKKWLWTQPCIVCGAMSCVQSHTGTQGTAKRLHDETSCSMCVRCHRLWHSNKILDPSQPLECRIMTEEEKAGIRFKTNEQFETWMSTLVKNKRLEIRLTIQREK